MSDVTRILVVRFSSIGDIVLTSPIVRALKSQLEGDVHLTFLTKKVFAGIVAPNPYVDEVIAIDRHVSEVADQLKDGMFDYVIDLHANLRSRQAKHATHALSFTLDKRNFAKWVYVNTKKEWLPIGHVVERSFQVVQALGVVDDRQGLDFYIPASADVPIERLPDFLHAGYSAYAIGGQMSGKILPTQKIIELCQAYGKPMVLLGGTEDRARGTEVDEACHGMVFNACGAFSLLQSASIIQHSEKVLTHDTGLMHIATALQKPVVSLWLATTPQLGFAPWMPAAGSKMIEANCAKRPTSKLGNRGYKDGCVFQLDLNAVVNALNQA